MKVTVEVLRIGPWRWMAWGEYGGATVSGYGETGAAAEADFIANTGHVRDMADSRYVKEIDV